MTAPKVSRRFFNIMRTLSLWTLFVSLLKHYAKIVKPSRVITLDPEVDGGPRVEYLRRWHLLPRNRWFNVYLHYFVHGDDDRALHDHPWRSMSLILDGSYIEHTSAFCFEEPLDRSAAGIETHTLELNDLFCPDDGRRYVLGSVSKNHDKFPGQHKFDYMQIFSTGDMRFLAAEHLHLIELFDSNRRPVWTLFVTGSRVRDWGFACGGRQGWRNWRQYHEAHPTRGNSSLGCD